MKKLMFWLVKRYADDELIRIDIMEILNTEMCKQYSEQTDYGNVYNWFYEVILATNFIYIKGLTKERGALNTIKKNIDKAFHDFLISNSLY